VLDPPLPEVAFLGRSNVGKSSLLNALTGRRIAKTSRTPGKTKMLNVFEVPGLYLLDLPGYGYARASHGERSAFRGLLTHALQRQRLGGVVWLLDLRRTLSADDRAMQDALAERGTRVLATFTKADKLARGERVKRERDLRAELGLADDQCVLTSARTGDGIDELREAIGGLVATKEER
jgi:GTP-binding protein